MIWTYMNANEFKWKQKDSLRRSLKMNVHGRSNLELGNVRNSIKGQDYDKAWFLKPRKKHHRFFWLKSFKINYKCWYFSIVLGIWSCPLKFEFSLYSKKGKKKKSIRRDFNWKRALLFCTFIKNKLKKKWNLDYL